MVEIFSVHVPKCAGQSLGVAFVNKFGEDAVFLDYRDSPFNPSSPINIDFEGHSRRFLAKNAITIEQAKIVHGHYYIGKYAPYNKALRVTILRDPLDRLLSHYFFWKSTEGRRQAIHQYFIANDLSLPEFAAIPAVRYFYTGVFFRGVDMASFDYVGDYANLPSSIRKIGKLLGEELETLSVNQNTHEQYERERQRLYADAGMLSTIRGLLRDDMAFYERHSR